MSWHTALTAVVVLLPASAAAAPSRAVPTIAREHEVKRGDTLSAIARRYGVGVAALVAANRLASADAILQPGQRLLVPAPPVSEVRRPAATPPRRLPLLRTPSDMVLAVPDFGHLPPLFAWPVDGPVSSRFGRRRGGWHRGVDIKADLGAPITAAAAGIVVASGWESRYGRVIKIEHPPAFITIYAHNSENGVEVGDRVAAGQAIGRIGRTGRASAHHLHFEIRHAGLAYNPLYLLPFPRRAGALEDGAADESDDARE